MNRGVTLSLLAFQMAHATDQAGLQPLRPALAAGLEEIAFVLSGLRR